MSLVNNREKDALWNHHALKALSKALSIDLWHIQVGANSLPLLTKELYLRHVDLVALTFQRLKDARGGSLSSRHDRPNGYSEDEVGQALQYLSNQGLARVRQTDYYEVTDLARRLTKADVIYEMLDQPDYYRNNKEALGTYHDKHRNENIFWFVGLLMFSVLYLLMAWYPTYFPTMVGPIALFAVCGYVLSFLSFGHYFSLRAWKKNELSVEKTLAVRLLDAYSDYKPFMTNRQGSSVASVKKAVQRIASSLEEVKHRTQTSELRDWETICSESDRVSRIGQELLTTVIPIIGTENNAGKTGELLVRLARLMFEGSPESVREAADLFTDLGFVSPTEARPIPTSLGRAVILRIMHPIFRRFIVLAAFIVIGYVILASVVGWHILGASTDYFGLLAAFFAAYIAAHTSLRGKNL